MTTHIKNAKPNNARRTAQPMDARCGAAEASREIVGILEEVKAISLETPALHGIAGNQRPRC